MLSDLRVFDVRSMGLFPERGFAGSAMHGAAGTGHSHGVTEHPLGNGSFGKGERTNSSRGTCSVMT